jgi:hypothetical protein
MVRVSMAKVLWEWKISSLRKKHNLRVLRPEVVRVECYGPNEHFEQWIESNEPVGSFPP